MKISNSLRLSSLQKSWNDLGNQEPFWAVLSNAEKKGNRWDPEEFFATGRAEINEVLSYIEGLSLMASKRKVLDFGCGVGRLTQAFCKHFELCIGVDIAPKFIELANKYNAFGTKCQYILNEQSDLSIFSDNDFDLVYSNVVLQHMKPSYALCYIREFLRIVKPNGLIVFQLPSVRKSILGKVKQVLKRFLPYQLLQLSVNLKSHQSININPAVMEMFGVHRDNVERFVRRNNGRVVNVIEDSAAGYDWVSYKYFIQR